MTNKLTHYCSRCKEKAPLNEWQYVPSFHSWKHVKVIQEMNAAGVLVESICAWIERVTAKV